LLINFISFIVLLYWVVLILFLLKSVDLLTIILYSEIIWVLLYTYVIFVGILNDDLVSLTTSFLLLALCGLEFCIGIILTILYRNFKKTFNLDITDQQYLKKKTIFSSKIIFK